MPLQLHITLLDVATCEISPNLYLEIWAANSTGFYSGFTTASQGGPPGGGPGGPSGSASGSASVTRPPGGGPPQQTGSSSTSRTYGASFCCLCCFIAHSRRPYTRLLLSSFLPLGPFDGADDPNGGGMGGGSNATDNLTFMRGITQADDQGEVTMYANIPGWYRGRAVHIHVRVFEGGTVSNNGSYLTSTGTLHHTGQIYFSTYYTVHFLDRFQKLTVDDSTIEQELVDEIALLAPYTANPLDYANATRNDEDGIYPYSTSGGYDPDLDTSLLGDTLEDGVLGDIVITINSTYISPSFSTAYHTAEDEDEAPVTLTAGPGEETGGADPEEGGFFSWFWSWS